MTATAPAATKTSRSDRAADPGRWGRFLRGSGPIQVGTVVILIALWEIVTRSGLVNRTLFPSFTDTVSAFVRLLQGGYWWEDLGKTIFAVAVAWLIGITFGFVMGVLLGVSPFVRTAITPYAIAVQALPKVVLAPLLIGWLGFGPESKIALAVIICFFPVWIDTMVGLSLPSANEFKLMRSLRANRWQVFLKLQLPSALPMIMVGVKHALLLSFTGVIVAEVLAASDGGLGQLTKEFSSQLNMGFVYAVVLIVAIVAITLVTLADVLERRLIFWSAEQRGKRS